MGAGGAIAVLLIGGIIIGGFIYRCQLIPGLCSGGNNTAAAQKIAQQSNFNDPVTKKATQDYLNAAKNNPVYKPGDKYVQPKSSKYASAFYGNNNDICNSPIGSQLPFCPQSQYMRASANSMFTSRLAM